VTRGRSILRRTARALPLAPVFVLLTAAAAFAADIQVTANAPPESARCALASPSAQCGQWTYWASLGATVIGVFVVVSFIVRYLKDAPKFQTESDGRAAPARAPAAASARPLAPPPPGAAPSPAAPATPVAAAAGTTQVATAGATAVAVADPPAVAGPSAPAAAVGADAAAAAAPVAVRPPSPRHEPVEPDQATYDKTLAEQLAKGTDRRVAEGRAKAAALKAAREQAGT
jgi:hypothetical protein